MGKLLHILGLILTGASLYADPAVVEPCLVAYETAGQEIPLGTKVIAGNGAVPNRVSTRMPDGSYIVGDFTAPGVLQIAVGKGVEPAKIGTPIHESPMLDATRTTAEDAALVVGGAIQLIPGVRDGSLPAGFTAIAGVGNARTARSGPLEVSMRPTDLGMEIRDANGNKIAKVTPRNLDQPWKEIEIETDATNAYGFGEFPRGTRTDEPWLGWQVRSNSEHGNVMSPFYGGVSTYTQFPVAYGMKKDGTAFAIFVDSPHKVEWDLREPGKWKMHTGGDEVRMHVLTGKDLPEVRRKYLDLTGKPPVPPRSIFGNGVSKFGYRNWGDVDHDVAEMNGHGLPVDMVGLDLYWFGGDFIHDPNNGGTKHTKMGTLTPDEHNFPNFEAKVRELKAKGTDVMLISESYVNSNLPEAQKLLEWGCVVKDEKGNPIVFHNKWWGTGYMIDWTHPKAAEWIKLKYLPLAKMGIRNFWFDLGEPEAGLYAPNGRYHGIEAGKNSHADIHNVYNLMWVQRFKEVMDAEMPNERFYMMNRSGTSGLQRHGAGKWSGDVGVTVIPSQGQFSPGDVPELVAHFQNRIMNMPMVGIDYYTSDVGGFHRWALEGNQQNRDKAYSLWYANSALLDIPFRPHLWVKPGEDRYLPTHTGDVASNAFNTRLRGEIEPYYYQAAHQASSKGEPIIAPLVYHYGSDPTVRQMGHEAMIGKDLLMGVVGNIHERERAVYLPEGGWYDYHSGEYHTAREGGRWLNNRPAYQDGNFRVPLFAREGAIIPLNRVTGEGKRIDANSEFRARVFAGEKATKTEILEDDGHSRNGDTRTTTVSQSRTTEGYAVTVSGALGNFEGARANRSQRLEIGVPSGQASAVMVNGKAAEVVRSEGELKGDSPKVYFDTKRRMAVVYQPSGPVAQLTRYEVVVKR